MADDKISPYSSSSNFDTPKESTDFDNTDRGPPLKICSVSYKNNDLDPHISNNSRRFRRLHSFGLGKKPLDAARKAALLEKRQKLCLGTKLQPLWESRTLKINPVTTDDLSRFLSNAQHTLRWAFVSQILYILWINVRKLPLLWSIIMFILDISAPFILKAGTPKRPWHVNGTALLISLFTSIFTNLLEARRRYIIGRSIDHKKCCVFQGRKSKIRLVRACDLIVGNVVKVSSDEEVPADIILLSSSNSDGQVHIDTSLLDGSNDLKVKNCIKEARGEGSTHSFAGIRGRIVCNKPSPGMDSFSGTLKLKGHPRPTNITLDNFVMRGSIIRNVSHVYGIVIYTGPDTKYAQNITDIYKPIKTGTFESNVNKFSFVIMTIYLICVVVSIATRCSNIVNNENLIVKEDRLTIESILFVFLRFIVLYGGLVPVTLPALMDVLRYLFSPFYEGEFSFMEYGRLNSSTSMQRGMSTMSGSSSISVIGTMNTPTKTASFNTSQLSELNTAELTSTERIVPHSWSLNSGLYEELGMVDFIFTDKTGTLTKNNLVITLLTIEKKSYRYTGDTIRLRQEIDKELPNNLKFDLFLKLLCMCNTSTPASNIIQLGSLRSSVATNVLSYGYKSSQSDSYEENIQPLKLSKSRAHFGSVSYIEPDGAVETKVKEEFVDEPYSTSSSDNPRMHKFSTVHFRSTSQEDERISELTRDLGYCLLVRTKAAINIDVRGASETWEIIGLNEFTSERKRMSIVLKFDGKHLVFVKGAADIMLDLLDQEYKKDIAVLKSRLKKHGVRGHRIILCAYRALTDEQVMEYQASYADAEESIYNREDRFEAAAALVENKLLYLGLVAFKDEIQEGVVNTLDILMDAGIRIWMVTGDGKDQAIESAYLTRLLVPPCRIFTAKLTVPGRKELLKSNELYDLFLKERSERASGEQLCLVVEGQDLKHLLPTPDLQTCFINMACFADIVIGCRLTPSQKSDLVKLVKYRLRPTPITLAIGDGMNDVKMIQEAHIGVGVMRYNNPHAISYADFAVNSFAALRKLLFLQGSRTLQAMSTLVYWSFFKCMCFTMPIFYYQGYTNWAGLDLYGSFIQMLFHLLFTFLPAIICPLFYRQLPDAAFANLPVLYTLSRRRLHINFPRLCFWILEGLITSILSYFSIQATISETPMHSEGGTLSARAFGLLCSLSAMVMTNTRMLIEFAPRNYLAIAFLTIFFVLGVPPALLFLTYTVAGRSSRAATAQVLAWQPLYFLVPLWLTSSILSYVFSAVLQAFLFPNLATCLQNWFTRQSCQCKDLKFQPNSSLNFMNSGVSITNNGRNTKSSLQHSSTLSGSTSEMRASRQTKSKDSSIGKSSMPLADVSDSKSNTLTEMLSYTGNSLEISKEGWCDCILERARHEFNIHVISWVSRMIPVARPFKIREGSVVFSAVSSDSREITSEDIVDDTGQDGKCVSRLINGITLRFKDLQLEMDYLLDKRKNHYRANREWYMAVFILLSVFYFLTWLLEYKVQISWDCEPTLWSLVPTIFMEVVLLGCIILISKTNVFVRNVNLILGTLIVCMLLQHIGNRFLLRSISWLHPVLFPIITFVILRITFVYSVLVNIIFLLITFFAMGSSIHSMPLFIGILVFVGFVGYGLEYNSRKSFLLEFSVANARKKQSELLNTMLPTFVVSKMINARLNENGIPIGFEAECHGTVSVLFCDVYNFHDLVATVEPTRLVELLDSLFLAFDRCSEQFDATKIETVSETYLTSFGLSRTEEVLPTTSAANAIDMALAMLEIAFQIRYTTLDSIKNNGKFKTTSPNSSTEIESYHLPIKIGINTGSVISGLVGAKKPQYALFGDTVNTASRMKSTGEVGHVHITESTYNLVKADSTLIFEKRETSVKGKGVMETYLLTCVVGSQYPNFEQAEYIHEVDALLHCETNKNYPNDDELKNMDKSYESDSTIQERIRSRKLRISTAIGSPLDDEFMIYDSNVLDKEYTLISGSLSSSKFIKCLPFRRNNNRRRSTFARSITSFSRSNTSSTVKMNTVKFKELKPANEDHATDIQMKKHELLLLRFADKLQEDRYRLNFYNNIANININESTLAIFLVTFVAQGVIAISLPRVFVDNDNVKHLLFVNYTPYWTVRSIFLAFAFMLWLSFHYYGVAKEKELSSTKCLTFFLNLLFVAAACIFALSNSWSISTNLSEIVSSNIWLTSDTIEFYFYVVVLHHNVGMLFQTCLLIDVLFIIMSMTYLSSSVTRTATTIVAIFTIPCCILFNLISAHCKEAIDRKTFYTNEKARMIETRVGQILNEMLPKSILEEFKSDRLKMTYVHEKMAFLFSDIVGFTSWANSVDASEVIALLQKLFARFDQNSTKFGLYKLCTIGDAYVAVSEPATEVKSNHSAVKDIDGVLQMAFSMFRTIEEVRESFKIPDLNMRIGLHYGSSIGGVIGSGRLRYDLWGIDIYIANKIESNGVPGRICVSERLRDIMYVNFPNKFTFKFNTEIQVNEECVRSYIIYDDAPV